MDMSWLFPVLTQIITGTVALVVGQLLNRRINSANHQKIVAEARSLDATTETNIRQFYKSQIDELLQTIERLRSRVKALETELQQKNVSLVYSDNIVLQVVREISDIFIIYNVDGKVHWLNQAAMDTWGVESLEQVAGKEPREFLVSTDVQQASAMVGLDRVLALEQKRPVRATIDYPTTKGILTFEYTITPHFIGNEVVRLSLVAREAICV